MEIIQKTFRYDTGGHWFKGNTHIHTPASDGGTDRAKITAMYAKAGYAFAFCTDHWVGSDLRQETKRSRLLWLDGIELDGTDNTGAYYHVVCLGRTEGLIREMGLVPAMDSARRQGALVVLAHPYWTGNTFEDALRWAFDGVEAYNHVCQWLNGKSSGAAHWSAMLTRHPNTLAFAADDAHLRPEHPGWNGGWIVVNAAACSPDAILKAIRDGNYYSSCGPQFKSIELDGGRVVVRTSSVQFVRLVGPGSCGQRLGEFGRRRLTQAAFDLPSDWDYAWVEIEDDKRRRAWTNTLFRPRP
jgi:hypothetical protein